MNFSAEFVLALIVAVVTATFFFATFYISTKKELVNIKMNTKDRIATLRLSFERSINKVVDLNKEQISEIIGQYSDFEKRLSMLEKRG